MAFVAWAQQCVWCSSAGVAQPLSFSRFSFEAAPVLECTAQPAWPSPM